MREKDFRRFRVQDAESMPQPGSLHPKPPARRLRQLVLLLVPRRLGHDRQQPMHRPRNDPVPVAQRDAPMRPFDRAYPVLRGEVVSRLTDVGDDHGVDFAVSAALFAGPAQFPRFVKGRLRSLPVRPGTTARSLSTRGSAVQVTRGRPEQRFGFCAAPLPRSWARQPCPRSVPTLVSNP